MSVQAITWAIEQDIPAAGQKLVLIALANYATKTGLCFPGQEALAKDTSQGTRTVRRHLGSLEQAGFITRSRRSRADGSRTSDEYQLNTQAAKMAGSDESQPAKTGRSSGQFGRAILEPSENRQKDISLSARATRLPEDWWPTTEETNYARQKGLAENEITRLRDDIVDWSQSSQNGAKLSWRATWQTWVRRRVDEQKGAPSKFGRGSNAAGNSQAGASGREPASVVAAVGQVVGGLPLPQKPGD